MKDDPKTLTHARHKLRRLENGSRIAQFMFLLIAYYFLLSGTEMEKYVLQSIANLFSLDFRMFSGTSGIAAATAKTTT